jgi:tetratricopeptide (TPR) repeat protein
VENDAVITAGDVEVVETVASMELIGNIRENEENKIVVGKVVNADQQYVYPEAAQPIAEDIERAKMKYSEPITETESVQKAEKAEKRKGSDESGIEEDSQEADQRIRTRKEQEYIEMLMKNPADIKAYWKLGLIYSKRHNYDDALACFRQIVKIDPTYTKAKQKALELMEKMKRK